jgi:hypothetical protein
MFILSCTGLLENNENNELRVNSPEIENQYLSAGYSRHERRYQLKDQYKEHVVVCPEFRSDADGGKPIVLIPEFLVPGRPYPLYVYLYAIALYSNMPEKGQRWAAEETRKRFGLATFAHTTLGRALKAFVCVCGNAKKKTRNAVAEVACDGSGFCFPTVRSTAEKRNQAAQALRSRPILAGRQQTIAASCELA